MREKLGESTEQAKQFLERIRRRMLCRCQQLLKIEGDEKKVEKQSVDSLEPNQLVKYKRRTGRNSQVKETKDHTSSLKDSWDRQPLLGDFQFLGSLCGTCLHSSNKQVFSDF